MSLPLSASPFLTPEKKKKIRVLQHSHKLLVTEGRSSAPSTGHGSALRDVEEGLFSYFNNC